MFHPEDLDDDDPTLDSIMELDGFYYVFPRRDAGVLDQWFDNLVWHQSVANCVGMLVEMEYEILHMGNSRPRNLAERISEIHEKIASLHLEVMTKGGRR
jgi:hypothetical protein